MAEVANRSVFERVEDGNEPALGRSSPALEGSQTISDETSQELNGRRTMVVDGLYGSDGNMNPDHPVLARAQAALHKQLVEQR